jgi:hypothetical protein
MEDINGGFILRGTPEQIDFLRSRIESFGLRCIYMRKSYKNLFVITAKNNPKKYDVEKEADGIYKVTNILNGHIHPVTNLDGAWWCDCESYHYRKHCSHVEEAMKDV